MLTNRWCEAWNLTSNEKASAMSRKSARLFSLFGLLHGGLALL